VRPKMSRISPADSEATHRAGTINLREVWSEHRYSEKGGGVFFKDITLARDGGFNEVGTLFRVDRFAWASFQIGCVVLNLIVVTQMNISRLKSQPPDFLVEADPTSKHLFLNNFIGIFIQGDRRASPAALLAFLEFGMLLYHFCRLAREVVHLLWGSEEDGWHALAEILWNIVPDLGSFSAMRPLHFVTPKIFIPSFTRRAWETYERRGLKRVSGLCFFLLSRVFFAFVGLEAFMIKFIIASEEHRSATSFWGALLVSAAFLNQMLGVVDMSKFAQRRLFTFIFGGEDSFISEYEMNVAKTWQAMLVMHMWEKSKGRQPRLAWFIAVGLAYGDTDFQRLTLNQRMLVKSMSNPPMSP